MESAGADSARALQVGAAIEEGRQALRLRAGADARRQAHFLLAGVMDLTPGELALVQYEVLDADVLQEYRRRIARRVRGEPLQYIEGRAAFRDLHLRVDSSVLIPRPETEQLVQAVLDWCRGREQLRALDLGTGSGAIAISLAREGPFAQVVAVDIASAALNLARRNAVEAGVGARVECRHGALFDPLGPSERFDVIVSNPPYVANGEADELPDEVSAWEPAEALFAGPTGMELIGAIIAAAPGHLAPDGLLALEIAPALAERTREALSDRAVYGEPRFLSDLSGQCRIVLTELSGLQSSGKSTG